MSAIEIDEALLDVRRAYRLLHDFQRAALDAAKYVGKRVGFTYQGGYPLFSNVSPQRGRGSLENWSWDWLNLVCYDFHFNNGTDENHFNLLIRLFSDTGYFMSDQATAAKTDVTSFAAPEASETKVAFILYGKEKWTGEHDKFAETKDQVRQFLEKDELPAKLRAAGIVGKCFPFSRLANEKAADDLVDELIKWAKANGFPMELTNKKG
jgi:hypothetical protein